MRGRQMRAGARSWLVGYTTDVLLNLIKLMDQDEKIHHTTWRHLIVMILMHDARAVEQINILHYAGFIC